MSAKWLVGGLVLVGAGTVTSLFWPGDKASIFILGATALIITWYTYETHRLAKSTEGMADSTRVLARAASRPNVVLSAEHDKASRGHRSIISNHGPGSAHKLWIIPSDAGGPQLLSHYVPPGQTVHIRNRARELLKGQDISLFWQDFTGQEYGLEWHFDGTHWVSGEPCSRAWQAYRSARDCRLGPDS